MLGMNPLAHVNQQQRQRQQRRQRQQQQQQRQHSPALNYSPRRNDIPSRTNNRSSIKCLQRMIRNRGTLSLVYKAKQKLT